MTNRDEPQLTRRRLLVAGAGAVAAASGLGLARGRVPRSFAAPAPRPQRQLRLVGTDGWVSHPLPQHPTSWFPDTLAPGEQTTYAFGFRNVTGLSTSDVLAQKGHAQASAPALYFDEGDEVTITITNVGLAVRPDLTDGHTIHWHGFRNAPVLFDGVPENSVAVPIGRDFPYFFRPVNAGTYMYHCHFEDVEHVQMGMTGVIFVRPSQNGQSHGGYTRFAYNDGDGSTGYDREYPLMVTEWWLRSHWNDAHIQESDWTEFTADVWMLNGRTYPDTLAPATTFDVHGVPATAAGDPIDPGTRLAYQPQSALLRGKAGDRILLRISNLGYQDHAITLEGLGFTVVGRDATLLRGRDGTDLSFRATEIDLGPGESADLIVTAPASSGSSGSDAYGSYDAYPLYDRGLRNGYQLAGSTEHTGMKTELRVYGPGSSLPAQSLPALDTPPVPPLV
jgi:FtsP/CotA-like multicopper oxidase with cupredoxin domain